MSQERFGADAAPPDLLMGPASCGRRADYSRPCGARFTDLTFYDVRRIVRTLSEEGFPIDRKGVRRLRV